MQDFTSVIWLLLFTAVAACINDSSEAINQAESTTTIQDSAPKNPDRTPPLMCENITNASYTGSFSKKTNYYSIKYARYPHASPWGRVSSQGWTSYSKKPSGSRAVALIPPDNHIVESFYEGGVLSITCDGQDKKILIPSFMDVEGDGFVDENNITFRNGFYVAAAGSVYYDVNLSKPVFHQ